MNNMNYAELFDYGCNISSRTVFLFGEINEIVAYRIIMAIDILASINKNPITMVINSTGGCVYSGLSIIDSMRNCGCETIVVGTGQIMSMAGIILQAPTVRKLTKHSTVMLHSGSIDYSGDPESVRAWSEHSKILDRSCNDLLAERTGKTVKYWANKTRSDLILSPEECLKLKLIDEIIV